MLKRYRVVATDATTSWAGAGIRFMKCDNSYYELIFPRLDDSRQRVILNKITDGVSETVYSLPGTNVSRVYNKWYDVSLYATCDGKIQWNVTRTDGTAITDDKNPSGSYTDPQPFALGQPVTIELITGGNREHYAYFDDLVCSTEENNDLTVNEAYSDDFETDTKQVKGNTIKLNDNWKAFHRGMGYDGKASFGIGNSITGVSTSVTNMNGKFLYVEARVEDMKYGQIPTVVYTGQYPSTKGYTVCSDVKTGTGNRGAGYRFMISDDEAKYYELYFPGDEYNKQFVKTVLNKVYKNADGNETRENLYIDYGTSSKDTIRGNVIYTMKVSVCNGVIDFSIMPKAGITDGCFVAQGTVEDKQSPYTSGKVGVLASGGSGKYAMYDDFSVSSYDYYVDKKAEPSNVVYREIASGKIINDGVIDLGKAYRIRRIKANNGTNVYLSNDGISYVGIGAVKNNKLINVVTNKMYRYVKLSDTSNAEVYTDMDEVESLPRYSKMKYIAHIGGADILDGSTDNADLSINDGVIYSNKNQKKDTVISFENEDYSIAQRIRITPEYSVMVDNDRLQFSTYYSSDISINNPIAIVRYYDNEEKLITSDVVTAQKDNDTIYFDCEYCPLNASISVIIKDGLLSMGTPFDEWVIR